MTFEEKYNSAIKILAEERKYTSKNNQSKFNIFRKNIVSEELYNNLYRILRKLHDEEEILDVDKYEAEVINDDSYEGSDNQPELIEEHLEITLNDKFDTWYESYLIKQNSNIENITGENFNKIRYVVLRIVDQLQISQSKEIDIDFVSSLQEISRYTDETINDIHNDFIDGLKYLTIIGVINNFKITTKPFSATVIVNVEAFYELVDKIEDIYHKSNKNQNMIPASIAPAILYNKSDGILIVNGKQMQFKDRESFRVKMFELLMKSNKNQKKLWSWDEIFEKIEEGNDEALLKQNMKKFYSACDGLSKQIALKLAVNDILLYNKNTVQINPKYLKN